MNKNFIELRESFAQNVYPVFIDMCNSEWNFYTNSNNENLKIMTNSQDKYSDIFKDKNMYKKFKNIKDNDFFNLSKHEQKQLKNIIKNFEEELNSGKELKALRKKENEIAQKFNSYIPKIDGKEVSKTDITKILQTESDIILRQKAYIANIIGADLIADDLKNFVKMRNSYAIKKGFSNYFEYKLKEDYDVDLNNLLNLLNKVYDKSKKYIKKTLDKEYNELKDYFKVEKLEPYHLGYKTQNNPESEVNKYLKNKEQIVEISKNTYNNMGYDIDNYLKEGKLTLDLFPRKNKNTHGFCFDIDAGLDARILVNLTNNVISLDTLNHEMGHCVYTLGISRDLTYFDRDTYPAITEAIAMMMGDIQKRENILKNIVPIEILDKFKKTFKDDEASFIAKSLSIINFEYEMYKNPEQNLSLLWNNIKSKYRMIDFDTKDNSWAGIPHYLSHPVYYQNYFRATLIKAQIYNYLKLKLGNITENKKTAKFLEENLFKFGTSFEENELIENMTGKTLSADDFINSLKLE